MAPIAVVHCDGAGPSRVKDASALVYNRVNQFEIASQLRPLDGKVVELQWNEVQLAGLLGSGSFSSVYRCRVTNTNINTEDSSEECNYALKSLSTETICCNDSFVTGAIDLALEAKILTRLSHENIVQLRGVKGGNIAESFSQGGGFFLVLDLLEETLDVRIDKWRKEETQKGFSVKAVFSRKRRAQKRLEAVSDRLDTVVTGIVRGMEYIHSKNIILRDLKPHNVGFGKGGKVKIFDFGLARELINDKTTKECGTRCNTGIAGTMRYISPENALGRPCGLPSDVYSFAIMLYEIITLQIPFSEIKLVSQFKERVLRGHCRPNLKWIPSALLQDLLRDGWDACPETRPTFSEIRCIMEELISSGLLTKEGEWRNFVFKNTKPGQASSRRNSGSHSKSFSDSMKRSHKQELDEEITILKQDVIDTKRAAASGSFHSYSNDQRRSFHENISFNSSKHQVHPL